jgi:hypothetical protein
LTQAQAREIWKRFGAEKVKALNAQGVSREVFIEFAQKYGDKIFDEVEKASEKKLEPVAHDA